MIDFCIQINGYPQTSFWYLLRSFDWGLSKTSYFYFSLSIFNVSNKLYLPIFWLGYWIRRITFLKTLPISLFSRHGLPSKDELYFWWLQPNSLTRNVSKKSFDKVHFDVKFNIILPDSQWYSTSVTTLFHII